MTNNFAVTGFVATDAEIRQCTNASVARFPLAISRKDNNGKRTSALLPVEIWRKNGNQTFNILAKGTMVTVEGYIAPNEWEKDGVKHSNFVMTATKVYETPDQEEEAEPEPEPQAKPKMKAKK